MGDLAEEFDKSWQEESRRHAAITIRNEVDDWCVPYRSTAEKRWLYELLQNSIDTAKENKIPSLDIRIEFKGGNLSVKHNGGGFLLKEIIALVSGGTSKYFGRETLGKFGKGFLVTHVLSKEVEVESSITHMGTKKPFRIKLDRRGDEKLIEQNINDCKEQLDVVVHGAEPANLDETTFTYINVAVEEASNCKVFCRPLPYVMIFNPIVENIDLDFELEEGPFHFFWKKRNHENFAYDGLQFEKIGISTPTGELSCIKIMSTKLELAALLTTSGPSPEVIDTRCFPVFYCNLPLCDSDTAGLSFAINSSGFEIDTNRSFINVSTENSNILDELPGLLNSLLDYLISTGTLNLQLLGHIDFSKLSEERKNYLMKQFFHVAEKLSSKPIVQCKGKNIAPCSSQVPSGDYLGQHLPKLTPSIYGLLTKCYANVPELYEEWETISREWALLGINLQTRNLENLLETLPEDIKLIQLGSMKEYVSSLMEALYSAQEITKSIPQEISKKKVLLNQKTQLVAPQDANIDLEVDEKLKGIVTGVGWDIQQQLLDDEILKVRSLREFISGTLCSGREVYTNDVVLKELWDSYVSTGWKENQQQSKYRESLLQLLVWLVQNKSPEDIRKSVNPRQLPILCSDGNFRCNEEVQGYPFLWPIEKVEEQLKQFSAVIGQRWFVSSEYLDIVKQDEQDKFLETLSRTSISFQTPIFEWTNKQLSEREATALASSGNFPNGIKIDVLDIIGLQDMTSAVAGGKDSALASKVLDFILRFVINNDNSWITPIVVGDKAVYSCYWLAVLKTKAWVPSIDGKLESLNKESWERFLSIPDLELTDNIVGFLGKHFGINLPGILALKLKVMNPSDYRTSIIDKLITLSTDDASKIAAEVEKRLRDIENVRSNQKLGRIVEEITKNIFEKQGFKTKWTGIGSDFRLVEPDEVGSLELQPSENPQDSGVLIEVKATRTEIARMTMVQAKKAIQSGTRYILCILDLSEINSPIVSDVEDPNMIELVVKSLKFVTDIGIKIEEAFKKADGFQDHQGDLKNLEIPPGVKIRFEETDIRLGVMKKIWEEGYTLEKIVSYCNIILNVSSSAK